MRCPLCQTDLPNEAQKCTRCDWVRVEPDEPQREADRHTRDRAAMWLSLVPGLGHLYKGHLVLGGAIFFLIGPLVLALSLSVLPATLGISLIIPLFFMVAVMLQAYHLPDRRGEVIQKARALDTATITH